MITTRISRLWLTKNWTKTKSGARHKISQTITVPDGQAFGNIDAEVMRARQGGDKLQCERTKAADDAISTAHKDMLFTHH